MAQEIIIDSYSEANKDDYSPVYSGLTEQAQSFTGNGAWITSCQFYLAKLGTISGNIACNVYAHSGTYGTSSIPTGSALITSSAIDSATITSSFVLTKFTFTDAYKTTNGTPYVLSIQFTGGSNGSNCLQAGHDISSPTHSGNQSSLSPSWSALSASDICFYVNGVYDLNGIQNKYRYGTVGDGMGRSESWS